MGKRGYPAGKYRSKFRIVNIGVIADFEKDLLSAGKGQSTVDQYLSSTRGFLRFIGGESQLARITEDTVSAFFKERFKAGKGRGSARRQTAMVIGHFLKFASSRNLPAANVKLALPLDERTALPAREDKALAVMREGWQLDKLKQQKDTGDDIIAKLGRKLIDHFLYFQSRSRGGPESAEELARLSEECQALIQAHLPLFLSLSAGGRNLGAIIDERVRR